MEEWTEYKALEFCYNVTDGTHDSPKPKEEGYYLITSKHLKDNGIDFASAKKISETDYLKVIQRSKVEQYDILYSMIGTIGNICQVKDEKVNFAVKNMGIFKMGGDELKSKWLYYWLKSPMSIHYVSSRLAGSTQSYLTLNSLREYPVLVPNDEDTMKRIVSILSSLDDKIEVNRCINEQLEELAGALFKSWFVDFEPFKDGEFVDSELGMIPKGWKVGTFSNVVDSTLGGDWGKENEQGNYTKEVFCIRGADIPEIKIGNRGKMPIRYILEKNFAKKSLANNDLVVEISGGSPTQSTGRVCRVTSELLEKYNNSLICTNFCRAIKPFADYSAYIYYYWQYLYDQGTMFNYENGTTGIKNLMINDILDKEPIVIPPINIVEQYKDVVETFATKIQKNGEEIEKLTTLRDTLLPKLMSGEIDVNEVEI